jgi:hypothetical protein
MQNVGGNIMGALNDVTSTLTGIGLEVVEDLSLLANLLPPDPLDPALNIMADVRAYFQGS